MASSFKWSHLGKCCDLNLPSPERLLIVAGFRANGIVFILQKISDHSLQALESSLIVCHVCASRAPKSCSARLHLCPQKKSTVSSVYLVFYNTRQLEYYMNEVATRRYKGYSELNALRSSKEVFILSDKLVASSWTRHNTQLTVPSKQLRSIQKVGRSVWGKRT